MLSEKLLKRILNDVVERGGQIDDPTLASYIIQEYFKEIHNDPRSPSVIKLAASIQVVSDYLQETDEELTIYVEQGRMIICRKSEDKRIVNLSESYMLADALVILAKEIVDK